eukprot:Awhi_evm1s12622
MAVISLLPNDASYNFLTYYLLSVLLLTNAQQPIPVLGFGNTPTFLQTAEQLQYTRVIDDSNRHIPLDDNGLDKSLFNYNTTIQYAYSSQFMAFVNLGYNNAAGIEISDNIGYEKSNIVCHGKFKSGQSKIVNLAATSSTTGKLFCGFMSTDRADYITNITVYRSPLEGGPFEVTNIIQQQLPLPLAFQTIESLVFGFQSALENFTSVANVGLNNHFVDTPIARYTFSETYGQRICNHCEFCDEGLGGSSRIECNLQYPGIGIGTSDSSTDIVITFPFAPLKGKVTGVFLRFLDEGGINSPAYLKADLKTGDPITYILKQSTYPPIGMSEARILPVTEIGDPLAIVSPNNPIEKLTVSRPKGGVYGAYSIGSIVFLYSK